MMTGFGGSLGPSCLHEDPGPMDGRGTSRDIFPLPQTQVSSRPTGHLSRKCKQRLGRKCHFQDEVQHTVDALNCMYSGTLKTGYRGTCRSTGQLSHGQSSALEFISNAVRCLGDPVEMSGPEALDALRVSEGYGGLPTSSPLGSYNPDLVSLPSGEMSPVSLDSLWGPGGQKQVDAFTHDRVFGPTEAQAKLIECGVERVYQDPKLNNVRQYAQFLQRLFSLNLIEFSEQPTTETVGLFFVKKKQGKLRLIMDCRRSNAWFTEPAKVCLATGDAMSRLEVPEGAELYTASADLANAFYTLELPEALRTYFGLKGLSAKHLIAAGVDSCNFSSKTVWIYPRVKVVPMGWAWALWWCQSISERVCERSGLSPEFRLRDGHPLPKGDFWHIQYVDNLHVIGTDKARVEASFWRAVEGLRSAGLTVHEIEVGDEETQLLGWELRNKGFLRPTRKRLWRLRIAVREILRRGHASGQQLERLVGHMTFVSLCKRESLSCFGEIYSFIRTFYTRVAPLWKSVRSELLKWDGVMPLIFSSLQTPWCPHIYAVDASEWGMGVVRSYIGCEESQRLGRYVERWRFKDEAARDPRAYVKLMDEIDIGDNIDDSDVGFGASGFKTVGFDVVDRKWQVVVRYPWKRADSMPVYEARSSLSALRHHLRSEANHATRVIVLTDSMTAAVAFDRGRANSYKLRRVIQQCAALTLCTGSSFRSRWVPSEWNPADAVSRGSWCASVPQRNFSDDPQTVGDPGQMGWSKEGSSSSNRQGRRTIDTCTKPRGSTDMGHRVREKSQGQEAQASSSPEGSQTTGSHEDFADELCHSKNTGKIPAVLGRVQGMVPTEDHRQDLIEKAGHFDDGIPGAFVSGGRGHEHGKLCRSGFGFLQSSMQGAGILTEGTAIDEGVAKIVSSKKPNAGAIRSGVLVSQTRQRPGQTSSLLGVDADVLPVSSTGGGFQVESSGHSQTDSKRWSRVSPLLGPTAPNRGGRPLQDHAMGRNDELGFGASDLVGTSSFQVPSTEPPQQTAASLQRDTQRGGGLPDSTLGDSRVETAGRATPISTSSRGSVSRRGLPVEKSQQHTSKGQMAQREVSSKLREGQPPQSAVRQSRPKRARTGNRSKRAAPKNVPMKALDPQRSLTVAVFLEIFCGCARLGRSVANICGWPVLLWDIAFGSDYDLTKRRNQQLIIHWISSGQIRGGHLGTPCNSYSRARDRPGGPPRLRSDQQPLGLPNLRPGDQEKVRIGNVVMRFSCRVLHLARRLRLPFTLENPQRSRLWICPPFRNLMRCTCVYVMDVTFCSFGTPWKKPTKFLSVCLDLHFLAPYNCKSSRRGECQYTGNRHIPLAGVNTDGIFLTKLAEPYPWRLTRVLAQGFKNTELAAISIQFQKYLN